jgi:hypothetical protein
LAGQPWRKKVNQMARARGHKFRVFVQDVGRTGYSGYADAIAWNSGEAVRKMHRPDLAGKLIAIRETDKHLWPDGKTGQLPKRRNK